MKETIWTICNMYILKYINSDYGTEGERRGGGRGRGREMERGRDREIGRRGSKRAGGSE